MLTLAAAAEQRRSFCFDCAGWVWTLITCCGLASPPDPEHGVIRLSGSENKQTLFPCSSSQPGPGKVRDSVPKISNHTSFLLLHMYVRISALVSHLEMLRVPSLKCQCHVRSGLAVLPYCSEDV